MRHFGFTCVVWRGRNECAHYQTVFQFQMQKRQPENRIQAAFCVSGCFGLLQIVCGCCAAHCACGFQAAGFEPAIVGIAVLVQIHGVVVAAIGLVHDNVVVAHDKGWAFAECYV